MLKKALILVFLLLISLSSTASAQQNLVLPQVEVDLWPEYDRPSMLVINHILLPESVNLPLAFSFRIPAAAGTPSAVAYPQDGQLLTIPYEVNEAGDWVEINFQAPSRQLQIEYYDPGLVKEGSQRSFKYTWPGGYAVNSFVVQVQQPKAASNLQISPSLGSNVSESDGLVYHTAQVGSLAENQTFSITINYEKATDTLTAADLPVEPSGSLNEAAAGRFPFTSVLPWFLGALGIFLIAGGLIWYWRSGQEPTPRRKRSRQTSGNSAPPASDLSESEYIYCHQCGKRAAPGDRFCRACGAPLRSG